MEIDLFNLFFPYWEQVEFFCLEAERVSIMHQVPNV